MWQFQHMLGIGAAEPIAIIPLRGSPIRTATGALPGFQKFNAEKIRKQVIIIDGSESPITFHVDRYLKATDHHLLTSGKQ